MNKNIFLSLALLSLLSCSPGPEYARPEFDIPKEFTNQKILGFINNDNQKIYKTWWEGFENPTINMLVDEALKEPLEIKIELAKIDEAKARLKLAGVGDNLNLDIGAGSNLVEEHNPDGISQKTTTNTYTGNFGFSIAPDLSGKVNKRQEQSIAVLEEKELSLKSKILQISSNVVQAYTELRGYQEQLNLLNDTIKLQEKTLNAVQASYDVGLSSDLDLQRSKALFENLKSKKPTLELNIQKSYNRITTLLGNFSQKHKYILLNSNNDFKTPIYKGNIPNLLPIEILYTRPDIRSTEAKLKQAIANIGIAKADYYPTIQIAGQISIGKERISSGSITDILVGTLSSIISQTILDGGKRSANTDIAEAEAKTALIEYKQALLNANEEIENILSSIITSKKRQESLKASKLAGEKSFYQAEELYNDGLIDFLSVIDAQRTWSDSKQKLALEELNYSTEIAKLFQAISIEKN